MKSTCKQSLAILFLGTTLIATLVHAGCNSQKKSERVHHSEDRDKRERQLLLVYIKLSDDKFGTKEERERLFKLEDEITPIVEHLSGEFDGNEIGGGFFMLYVYGTSADELLDAISPILNKFPIPIGSYAEKRYRQTGDQNQVVKLGIPQKPIQ